MEGVAIPSGYKVVVATNPLAKTYEYDTSVRLYRREYKFWLVPCWVLVTKVQRDLRAYPGFDERVRGIVSWMIERELHSEAFAKKSAVYYGGS